MRFSGGRPYFLVVVAVFAAFAACSESTRLTEAEQEILDQRLIREYLAAKNLTGFKMDSTAGTNNGTLWYKVLNTTVADSPLVNSSSLVFVRYKGMLLNGQVIDEKIDTTGFRLSSTIQGWRTGLSTYLRKKGEIRLIIPSKLAYGKYDQQNIPANSVVDYQITLDSIGN